MHAFKSQRQNLELVSFPDGLPRNTMVQKKLCKNQKGQCTQMYTKYQPRWANAFDMIKMFIHNLLSTSGYCKFGKDCVRLIFAFFAFSLGRKIKIYNDYCCHFKCMAGTLRKVKKRKNLFSVNSQNLLYTIFCGSPILQFKKLAICLSI